MSFLLLPDVCQRFMIVTIPTSLSLWEAQFSKLAPHINVVVYDGEDKLKTIQDLEFYEHGMLQVLLTHTDAILEDSEPIARIGWETIIIDYDQKSTLKYLEQLKQLSTDFRLLLLSSPIKDNLSEYHSLLDFLKSGNEDNNGHVDNPDALEMSKIRFTSHIAYVRKADSSNFLEYWVPAYISQVQLEYYCFTLLSNSPTLQSQLRDDSVGALRGILLSLSKCCNHPHLIDKSPQTSLANNHNLAEKIDTRVYASGKLLLLDKMLREISNKRLRVIILFQSGGAGGNPVGDTLEGVVRHRLGPESYERVEHSAVMSRKQAAINMFNDKANGRSVFLIESRACLPSIKLSSIDAIVIYDSDWNPLNDLKALQRINLKPRHKDLSIFRLYTPFTVEEKTLVLAKQGVLIDSNSHDTMNHSLISWGASFLFTRLDELQQDKDASKSSEREMLFMDTVISEFLRKLPMSTEDNTEINNPSISKANMSGEFYSRSITLIGEKEAVSALDGDPSEFWLNLLDGKSPCWRHISEPPQSSHGMLQDVEELGKVPADEANGARRKRRKVDAILGSSSKVLYDNTHDDMLPFNCTTSRSALQPLDDIQHKLGVESPMCTPENLQPKLKQELAELIKVLQLPDHVTFLVQQFFEYLLKNHLVFLEPMDMLHMFIIALCWHAASLLNYNLDHEESLALAGKSLNYEYSEKLTELMYEKLRKKKFLHKAGETSSKRQPMSVENTEFSWEETSTNLRNDMFPGNLTNSAPQGDSSGAEHIVSEEQEVTSVQENHRGCHVSIDELRSVIVEKRISLLDDIFSLREQNLLDKQQLEISDLETHRENEVIRLKKVCDLVLEHIRRSHIDEMTRNHKIKLAVQWFTLLLHAFLDHMSMQVNQLEALQSNTWSKEQRLKENFQQQIKSGQLDLGFDEHSALPDSNFIMEEFIYLKEQNDVSHTVDSSVSNRQQPSDDRLVMVITMVRNAVPSEPNLQAVRDEPAGTSVDSTERPSSETVDFPENNICCNSDDIDLQRAGCLSNAILANDDSSGQESSTSQFRNTEHSEKGNIAYPCMLLGGGTSLALKANAYDGIVNQLHLESPILASSQSTATLSICREVRIDDNLSTISAQQTIGDSQHPPVEAEPTNTLGVIAASDLQHGKQTLTSALDTPFQRACPDDMGQTGHQSDRATGVLQEGTISYHLASVSVKSRNDETVVGDPLHSETQSYTAPHNPVARKVKSQTHELSMPPQQSTSTSLPPQQKLALGRPSADVEPASIMSTEAGRDLQAGVQPAASVSDAPLQRLHPSHSCQTGYLPVTSPGMPQGDETRRHSGDAKKSVNEKNSSTMFADDHSESPTCAATQILAIFPVPGEVGTLANLSSIPSSQNIHLSAQQNKAPSRHPPAEAERTGLLGTQPEQDLEPEIQPSTSFPDTPLERMHPDDRGLIGREPDTTTGQSQGGAGTTHDLTDVRIGANAKFDGNVAADPVHSASQTYSAETPATLAVAAEVETPTSQSSALVQESTSLPAQQSTTTSQRPPAEAEPAGILRTGAAQGLQSETQPSTSMLEQPTEAGESVMLCASAAQYLQLEMQRSTSTQDVERTNTQDVERTNLSGMPVLQSMPVRQNVELSRDPHAGLEPAGTLGMVTTHDLLPELQPSISIQDRHEEAAGTCTLGTAAAQNLQIQMQTLTAMLHGPLEITLPENRSQTGFGPNTAPSSEHPTELLPGVAFISNYSIVSDHPLKNELERLRLHSNLLNESHKKKKSQLLIEHKQEIEQMNKKYDLLLQKEDSTFVQSEMKLDAIYKKVFLNQSLAEDFAGKIIPSSGGRGRSTSPAMEQPLPSSSATQITASTVPLLSAMRPPPVLTSFGPLGLAVQVQPSLVPRQSSSRAFQPQSILPGNLCRATSALHIPTVQLHGNYGSVGRQSCAPSPHLQQLRMRAPYPMVHTNQEQVPVSLGATSLRQFAHSSWRSFASTSLEPGPILTSMAPSSSHRTIPSASNSFPAQPASSLPSVPHPQLMSNFVQSSLQNHILTANSVQSFYSNHTLMAARQSSGPNIVLQSAPVSLNTAPGTWQAGGQIAGVNQYGSQSASLGARMTSNPAGAASSAPVVCLSDDE